MTRLHVFVLLGFTLLSQHALAQAPGTFVPTGSMTTPRGEGHTATLLRDGRVLVTGGTAVVNGHYEQLSSAELFDPATGTFTPTGAMSTPRNTHTATLLNDGRVLITGGFLSLDSNFGRYGSFGPSAEIYDPSTGTFTPTGAMVILGQTNQSAILLGNGKVLILEGDSWEPIAYGALAHPAAPELYDPATGAFALAGDPGEAILGSTSTLLTNGNVLVVGGTNGSRAPYTQAAYTYLFNPASGKARVLGHPFIPHPITGATATLLQNGTVLISGGIADWDYLIPPASQIYDPLTGTFQPAGTSLESRAGHTATLLRSGLVLFVGGQWGEDNTALASAELYDPATGAFSATGGLSSPRVAFTATLLNDGRVLITGGREGAYVSFFPALATAEIYVPPAWPIPSPGQ